MPIIVIVLLIAIAIAAWPFALAALVGWGLFRLIRHLMMKRYFASPAFLAVKAEIASIVAEHNDVANYVNEIRENGTFTIGQSNTGAHAHLASSVNTSKFGYKRDRNVADYGSKFVHNASLQVVRNAAADPIKYLIKYFEIASTEETLAEIEALGESVSRLENAVRNVKDRGESISETIAPPNFILKHYKKEFEEQVGLAVPPLEIPYSKYQFQYVSAGGNSSQVTTVTLDSPTIDSLLETLSEKIRFKKSAAGQRSLMTAKFRNQIKTRDKFTCLMCSVSIEDEEHLLLEVDHIQPVSKGGLSIETNLQTLCWRCNRSKSNKEITT